MSSKRGLSCSCYSKLTAARINPGRRLASSRRWFWIFRSRPIFGAAICKFLAGYRSRAQAPVRVLSSPCYGDCLFPQAPDAFCIYASGVRRRGLGTTCPFKKKLEMQLPILVVAVVVPSSTKRRLVVLSGAHANYSRRRPLHEREDKIIAGSAHAKLSRRRKRPAKSE